MLVRLLAAALFGGRLGFERTRKMRAAGLRTYALVCIGAAAAMIVGLSLMERYGADPGRIPAQVICGIGFIGAGTIMMTGYHRVRGLTTAAGLWSTACMGIADGTGFYTGALAMTIIMLLAMTLGEKLQNHFLSKNNRVRIYVLFEDATSLQRFFSFLREEEISVNDFEQLSAIGNCVGTSFVLKFQNRHKHAEVLKMVADFRGVAFVEEI